MDNIKYLEKYLPKEKLEHGKKLLKQGIPVQYIVGNVDFFGNEIKVNKNVLIPRFETELLIEKTIKYIKKQFNKKLEIIDLGTGSGCIAITLKKELDCNIDAVDISEDALNLAKENARSNGVNINFILNDMLSNINKKYDVIISNPPYISKNEEIMSVVKNNEPSLALYADNDGLYFYEEILSHAKKNLNNSSIIALEIGYWQKNKIIAIANNYFPDANIFSEKDYNEKDRYVFVINKIK